MQYRQRRARIMREKEQRRQENAKRYEFLDIVLNWYIYDNKLYCPEEKNFLLQKLLPNYPYSQYVQYFSNFKPLILEESRAIVRSELDKYFQRKSSETKVIINKCAFANEPNLPSKFTLHGDLVLDDECGTSTIVLMEIITGSILLADIIRNNEISAKCILNESNKHLFENDTELAVLPLGSLITQKRMYDVCTNMPRVCFERQLLNPIDSYFNCEPDDEEDIKYDDRLNPSQNKAIHAFLQLESGLQLLQGPPGTGKTTTSVVLIEKLFEAGYRRILVTAPSNKAVQVLAKKVFDLSTMVQVPMILAGVEKK